MKTNHKPVIFFLLILAVIGLSTGGKFAYEQTSTSEFCGSCHVMDKQFDSWQKRGPHGNLRCVDCHLPHGSMVEHLVWKGIDGGKDLIVFHSGLSPEVIRISEHGRETVRENCVRCHENLLVHTGTEPDCVRCHRQTHHTAAPQLIH